jgi:hypothetical protein
MPSYDALPGKLGLSLKAGDDFSALIDFSVSLTATTMTSAVYSLVSGASVATFSTTLVDDAGGKVNVALSDSQTSALPPGTYRWEMIGNQGSLTRTYLEGAVEVVK